MAKKFSTILVAILLPMILISSSLCATYTINVKEKIAIQSSRELTSLPCAISDPDYEMLLVEGFENKDFPPENWETISENTDYSWQLDMINVHQGNHSACCHHDPYATFQDEWMITPPINLSGYTEIFLQFYWFMSYFWSVDPYDQYDFTICIIADNESDWIPLWSEEQVGLFENWIWYNTSKGESIDLSSYIDQQEIRIGFGYNGSDGAQLNVDDICIYGSKITNPLKVNAGGPYEGYVGEKISFNGNASGGAPPYTWSWDLGDGTEKSDQNFVHSYEKIGNYTVKLEVTDSLDITRLDTTIAWITNMSKVPELIITNVSGSVGLQATICNRGCVDATNIFWQIHIHNNFVDNTSRGNISFIKKKCSQEIASNVFSGFGFVEINIVVKADNMNRISKEYGAMMIGRYLFLLSATD